MAKTRKRARTTKRVRGAGCAGSSCKKDPLQERLEFLQSQLFVIGNKKDRDAIRSEISAIQSRIALAKGQAALAKGLTNATRALSSGPSASAIKGQMKKFEEASAGVKAVENAVIKGSASAAGVSESEVNAYIAKLQEEERARLRASLPSVPTGPVVIGGRLKSRRRK